MEAWQLGFALFLIAWRVDRHCLRVDGRLRHNAELKIQPAVVQHMRPNVLSLLLIGYGGRLLLAKTRRGSVVMHVCLVPREWMGRQARCCCNKKAP